MIVRYNKGCNNKCVLCDKCFESNPEKDVVVYCGGEPLAHTEPPVGEVAEMLSMSNSSFKHLLRTNSRLLANNDLIQSLIKRGINNFKIPFFSHNKKSFDEYTRIEGSFEDTVHGLGTLFQYPVNLIFELKINDRTIEAVKETESYLKKNFPNSHFLASVDPAFLENNRAKVEDLNLTFYKANSVTIIYNDKLDKNLYQLLRESLESEYNLSVERIKPIYGGSKNLNFIVYSKENKYFLKVLNKRIRIVPDGVIVTPYDKMIANQVDVFDRVESDNFEVLRPFKTREGDFFFSVKGCPSALFPFVLEEEDVLSSVKKSERDLKVLAEFHKVGGSQSEDGIKVRILDRLGWIEESGFQPYNKYGFEVRDVIRELRSFINSSSCSDLPKFMLHGDAHYGNFIFNEITYLIDVEYASKGPRVYDLAHYVYSDLKRKFVEDENTDLASSADDLISTYETFSELSFEERECFQYYLIYVTLMKLQLQVDDSEESLETLLKYNKKLLESFEFVKEKPLNT